MAGAKGWELYYRKAATQLAPALESQVGGDRVIKGPDHRGQAVNETSLQQLKHVEGQTPEDPRSRSPCSSKAMTQLPTLCENPNTEDKYSRKPTYKETDCHRARPHDLIISEGHIWDGTSAGLEQGSLALRRTKPPKSQYPSARSSRHGLAMSSVRKDGKTRGLSCGDEDL